MATASAELGTIATQFDTLATQLNVTAGALREVRRVLSGNSSALDRKTACYEVGVDALRLRKSMWDSGRATDTLALHAPFYAQTLDFTCGPCALLMAMAALDAGTVLDRTAENWSSTCSSAACRCC